MFTYIHAYEGEKSANCYHFNALALNNECLIHKWLMHGCGIKIGYFAYMVVGGGGGDGGGGGWQMCSS